MAIGCVYLCHQCSVLHWWLRWNRWISGKTQIMILLLTGISLYIAYIAITKQFAVGNTRGKYLLLIVLSVV